MRLRASADNRVVYHDNIVIIYRDYPYIVFNNYPMQLFHPLYKPFAGKYYTESCYYKKINFNLITSLILF